MQEFNPPNTTLRSANIAFYAGLGATYQLMDGWQVGAAPFFNSHLLSMIPSDEMSPSVSRRLFSVGLNLVTSYTW